MRGRDNPPVWGTSPFLAEAREALEDAIERGIALLDMMDAPFAEREPDGEDEIVSEDDAPVRGLRQVGRQFGSATG